jgi:hypothetical protein
LAGGWRRGQIRGQTTRHVSMTVPREPGFARATEDVKPLESGQGFSASLKHASEHRPFQSTTTSHSGDTNGVKLVRRVSSLKLVPPDHCTTKTFPISNLAPVEPLAERVVCFNRSAAIQPGNVDVSVSVPVDSGEQALNG